MPLSDPSRPAVVTLDPVHGGVTVAGTNRRHLRFLREGPILIVSLGVGRRA